MSSDMITTIFGRGALKTSPHLSKNKMNIRQRRKRRKPNEVILLTQTLLRNELLFAAPNESDGAMTLLRIFVSLCSCLLCSGIGRPRQLVTASGCPFGLGGSYIAS